MGNLLCSRRCYRLWVVCALEWYSTLCVCVGNVMDVVFSV